MAQSWHCLQIISSFVILIRAVQKLHINRLQNRPRFPRRFLDEHVRGILQTIELDDTTETKAGKSGGCLNELRLGYAPEEDGASVSDTEEGGDRSSGHQNHNHDVLVGYFLQFPVEILVVDPLYVKDNHRYQMMYSTVNVYDTVSLNLNRSVHDCSHNLYRVNTKIEVFFSIKIVLVKNYHLQE